jgi:hypothetical protein
LEKLLAGLKVDRYEVVDFDLDVYDDVAGDLADPRRRRRHLEGGGGVEFLRPRLTSPTPCGGASE